MALRALWSRRPHRDQVADPTCSADPRRPRDWDRVQRQIAAQTQTRADPHRNTEFFLAGKFYDDRGNRMGPSHAANGRQRWRYHVSRALLKGRKPDAGPSRTPPGSRGPACPSPAHAWPPSAPPATPPSHCRAACVDRTRAALMLSSDRLSCLAKTVRETYQNARETVRFCNVPRHSRRASGTKPPERERLYLSDALIAASAFDPGQSSRSDSSLSGRSAVPRTSCSSFASSST